MSDLLCEAIDDLVQDGFNAFAWCADDGCEAAVGGSDYVVLFVDVDYPGGGFEYVGVVFNLRRNS